MTMHRGRILMLIGLLATGTPGSSHAEYEYRAISEHIVRHEYAKAERALRTLVDECETEAMYRLAGLYRGGQGFERRLDESASLYLRAAESGHRASMFLVAQCYERGIGVPSGTLITGSISAQPALHGILNKIRDLNLTLISVRKMNSEVAGSQGENTGG